MSHHIIGPTRLVEPIIVRFSGDTCGRGLKSFRMLLDRRRPLVNELRINQQLPIIMCSVSFLP